MGKLYGFDFFECMWICVFERYFFNFNFRVIVLNVLIVELDFFCNKRLFVYGLVILNENR